MKNHLFIVATKEHPNEGKSFVVMADTYKEAIKIAKKNFDEANFAYCGTISDLAVECSGLNKF